MTFENKGVNSGYGILGYLVNEGVEIVNKYSLDTSDNYVIIPEHISFNWKAKNKQIRVNCKENAKQWIEEETTLRCELNGKGDTTREYSFLLDSFEQFSLVVEVLKQHLL